MEAAVRIAEKWNERNGENAKRRVTAWQNLS